MTRTWMAAGLAGAVLMVAAGCGKSEEQKAAEEAAKATQKAAEGAQQAGQAAAQGAAQAGQDLAKGFEQLAKGMQGAQTATVVDFEKLQALLPEVSGWKRGEPKGEQVSSMGVKMSRASAQYSQGDSEIDLEITDSALSQMIMAPMSMMLAAGYNERSSDGYKKSATVSGQPGFEEWSKNSKHAEVTAVVANRFIVTAKADNVTGPESARKLVESVNLAKLAVLK
jgi:hypothetical protein